jgi:hypothetical protein
MNRLLDQFPLRHGAHSSPADGMCAMELVAWLAGEPHTDEPECTCPVIAAYVRAVNDAIPTDVQRERLLRPLVPHLIRTRGTAADEQARGFVVVSAMVHEFVPHLLETARFVTAAQHLRVMAEITDADGAKAALAVMAERGVPLPAARWVLLRASEGMAPARYVGTAAQMLRGSGRSAMEMLARTAARLAGAPAHRAPLAS